MIHQCLNTLHSATFGNKWLRRFFGVLDQEIAMMEWIDKLDVLNPDAF